jgi:hypothetical protein
VPGELGHGGHHDIDLLVRLEAAPGEDQRPIVGRRKRLRGGERRSVHPEGDDLDRQGATEVVAQEGRLGLGAGDDRVSRSDHPSTGETVGPVKPGATWRVARPVVVSGEDERPAGESGARSGGECQGRVV